MNDARRLVFAYVLNLALLTVHEIDSAYWHEWKLFGLPGGIQLFLVLNFALVLAFLFGLVQLVRSPRAGIAFSFALAVAGVLAFVLHGILLWQGHPEFRLPVCLAVLVLTFFCSLYQGWLSFRFLSSQPTGRRNR